MPTILYTPKGLKRLKTLQYGSIDIHIEVHRLELIQISSLACRTANTFGVQSFPCSSE